MEINWLLEENPVKHTSQLLISKTHWSVLYYTVVLYYCSMRILLINICPYGILTYFTFGFQCQSFEVVIQ